MAFGAAIRAVRIRSGAMQKAIALSSEIDQSVLAGWESGRRPAPRAKQLQRLLKALSPSVEERNRILLAWELARLSRSLHGHDEAFKETVLRLASWLAAMGADERAAWCAITGRLQPALLRKEGTMA
jgi:predicted transcriptional regulator